MVRDIGQVWLHPTISQRSLKADLTGFSCSSDRCFHGLLLKKENPGLPHAALYDLAKSKDRTTPVLRYLLREGQQTTAREVVLVQVTTSGHKYLLPGNTCNYQTANRKLKILAPNIYPIKCHYNTSTHLSFFVWHSAEVKGLAQPPPNFISPLQIS